MTFATDITTFWTRMYIQYVNLLLIVSAHAHALHMLLFVFCPIFPLLKYSCLCTFVCLGGQFNKRNASLAVIWVIAFYTLWLCIIAQKINIDWLTCINRNVLFGIINMYRDITTFYQREIYAPDIANFLCLLISELCDWNVGRTLRCSWNNR